jgi:hypothetical protein
MLGLLRRAKRFLSEDSDPKWPELRAGVDSAIIPETSVDVYGSAIAESWVTSTRYGILSLYADLTRNGVDA